MKKIIFIFVVTLIISITYSCVKTAEATDYTQYTDYDIIEIIDSFSDQVAYLTSQISELEEEIEVLTLQMSELEDETEALTLQIAGLNEVDSSNNTTSYSLNNEISTPMIKTVTTASSYSEYTYDTYNRVTTWTVYSSGEIFSIHEYEYDGNTCNVYYTNSDGERSKSYVYEYFE